MALAKPVISTRHSGIPELVLDGACGLLADEGDHRGLASAIETLADQPALRQQFGQAGRARVAEAFDMAALGVALRGLYIELLGSPGAE
jgi:colanic acid/amylovoran biosynthesis glycosyltransferase